MKEVVVDASIVTKWLIVEADSSTANRLWLSWHARQIQAFAPSWVAAEVSNALLQATSGGRHTIHHALSLLRELPRFVRTVPMSVDHSLRALERTHSVGLRSTYDAHYVALAEELDCELWTADERFWRTVRAEHPRVRWLGGARGAAKPPAQ